MLVRNRELACRTSWGSDLWEALPEISAVDVKIWGPFAGDLPMDDLPSDLIAWLIAMASDEHQ